MLNEDEYESRAGTGGSTVDQGAISTYVSKNARDQTRREWDGGRGTGGAVGMQTTCSTC